MKTVILAILAVSIVLLALIYKRYISGNLRHVLGLTLIFVLAFANVLLATGLVVPLTEEYRQLQLIAAAIVAAGSAIGARKARSIAESGLRAYDERPSSGQRTDAD